MFRFRPSAMYLSAQSLRFVAAPRRCGSQGAGGSQMQTPWHRPRVRVQVQFKKLVETSRSLACSKKSQSSSNPKPNPTCLGSSLASRIVRAGLDPTLTTATCPGRHQRSLKHSAGLPRWGRQPNVRRREICGLGRGVSWVRFGWSYRGKRTLLTPHAQALHLGNVVGDAITRRTLLK